MRTDEQIIEQTNELARALYALRGYIVRDNYLFYHVTHPHEVEAWNAACLAQEMLTQTDVPTILDEMEE